MLTRPETHARTLSKVNLTYCKDIESVQLHGHDTFKTTKANGSTKSGRLEGLP